MTGGRGLDSRFMQELKQKNDIVEVASSYISLDRKGGNHWACCPFHHERTASFAINGNEQFYHCFGCGVSGDVVKFVQEMESTDFMGAVRILAARAKMEVPESNFDSEKSAQLKKKRDSLAAILLDSARFYLANLYSGDKRAEAHLAYIAKRKLSPTTVKKFGLGASLDFYSLPDYLTKKGYSREDLLDSGVLAESKNGKLIDALAGRLIFPIINAMDEVVGFGGRELVKTDFAKYKNTKETMLFNKRNTLYNINLLKKLKRSQQISEVIIVEGYMDTISLYQAGFQNVVASMGTSLTKEQAKLIKRYTQNVLISYDGDFAGQNADLRGLEILKDEGLTVKVVPMPEGQDPDDVAKQGAAAYQKCLDEALPLIDYKLHALERKFDLSDKTEKRAFLNEALKVVKDAESEAVREELLIKLRELTGVTYQALERDLESAKESAPVQIAEVKKVEQSGDKYVKAARFVLAAKLFDAPYAREVALKELPFANEEHLVIAAYVMRCEENGERIRPSELFDVLEENSKELSAILDLNYKDKLTGETAEKFFLGSVSTLKITLLEREIAALNEAYSNEQDAEKRKQIGYQLSECILKKSRLK